MRRQFLYYACYAPLYYKVDSKFRIVMQINRKRAEATHTSPSKVGIMIQNRSLPVLAGKIGT